MAIKNNILKLIYIIILFSLTTSSCQKKNMEEKFIWSGTLSAPQEYPIQAYSGSIIADDFRYDFDDIWGQINQGWGKESGSFSSPDKTISIPDSLEFTWFSIAENKFYTGKWALDKVKITQLFKEGHLNTPSSTKKTSIYDTFVVGLAPKGKIVLWLVGGSIQKEVGIFQAKETIIKKQDAYENFKYTYEPGYRNLVLGDGGVFKLDVAEKIKKEGYPNPDIYDTYRERYKWRPKIILPEGSKFNLCGINICNGEKELLTENKETFLDTGRGIPYYFYISWTDKLNKTYNAYIVFTDDAKYLDRSVQEYTLPLDFDKNEVNNVFKQKLKKEEPFDFIVKVNSNHDDMDVYVEQNGTKINFIKIQKEIELE
jgi:Protein of unknown function (DUF2931)